MKHLIEEGDSVLGLLDFFKRKEPSITITISAEPPVVSKKQERYDVEKLAELQTKTHGDHMSVRQYKVKARSKRTGRIRTVKLNAVNEDDLHKCWETPELKEQYEEIQSVEEVPYEPPSDRQKAYAQYLGLTLPTECCKEDCGALLDRRLHSEGRPFKECDKKLEKFLIEKVRLPFSLYCSEQIILSHYYWTEGDLSKKMAFLIIHLRKERRTGVWDFKDYDRMIEKAKKLIEDPKVAESIKTFQPFVDYFYNPRWTKNTRLALRKALEFLHI